ncbi:MAG: hypothetical protein H6617_07730 [Bdellovibrionaceae bacterium]|nr:hypothetical protein [Pseudobdellovibrionaceae bacterium]
MGFISRVAYFSLFLTQVGLAQDASDLLKGLVSTKVNRFEVAGEVKCGNGFIPQLSKFVQYRSKKQGEWLQWSTGPAKNYAPYLWLSVEGEQSKVYLASMVKGEWIYCDDDGHEFTYQKDYWFQTRYSVAGDSVSAQLSRQEFFSIRNQSMGFVEPDKEALSSRDLEDAYFFYKDPVVNGPAEHWTYMTSKSLELGFEQVDADTLLVSFPGACANGEALKVSYQRSNCESPYFCRELPAAE